MGYTADEDITGYLLPARVTKLDKLKQDLDCEASVSISIS